MSTLSNRPPGTIERRAHVGVEVEGLRSATLTERKPPPIGVSSGPLSASSVLSDRLDGLVRHRVVELVDGRHAREAAIPIELRAGGFENANGGVGDVGPDAVAGNQRARNAHM